MSWTEGSDVGSVFVVSDGARTFGSPIVVVETAPASGFTDGSPLTTGAVPDDPGDPSPWTDGSPLETGWIGVESDTHTYGSPIVTRAAPGSTQGGIRAFGGTLRSVGQVLRPSGS